MSIYIYIYIYINIYMSICIYISQSTSSLAWTIAAQILRTVCLRKARFRCSAEIAISQSHWSTWQLRYHRGEMSGEALAPRAKLVPG